MKVTIVFRRAIGAVVNANTRKRANPATKNEKIQVLLYAPSRSSASLHNVIMVYMYGTCNGISNFLTKMLVVASYMYYKFTFIPSIG